MKRVVIVSIVLLITILVAGTAQADVGTIFSTFGPGDSRSLGLAAGITNTPASGIADLDVANTFTDSDTTPPVITPNVSGTLGDNGWYTSDVSVSWTVSDDESAITSTSGCDTTPIVADTTGITLTCEATSNGGTASASVTVKRDATPPTASASVSPAANANGWYNSDVIVSFSGSDALSGIASCDADIVLSSEGTGQSASGVCTDNAGNFSATATASGINIDKTPPTASASVSPAANANGWYNSGVTVSFSGSDALSGIASCDADVILSSEGADQSASGTCTDNAGNVSATATASGINIDKTAPVVNVTGVEDGATYILGSVPTAGCDTSDSLSGVATEASLSLSGGNANGVGSFTATCDGVLDNAGNRGSAGVSYSVVYGFGGFTDPIDPQAVNQVKAGQTVPVKFSLNGDQGMAILADGYPVSQEVACDGSATVNTVEVEETDTAGNSSLSYDPDSDQYSYIWKTDKGWSGTCRQLIIRFDDGSEYTVPFQFR